MLSSRASFPITLCLFFLYLQAGREFRLRFTMHAGTPSEIVMTFGDFGLTKTHVDAVFGGFVGNSGRLRAWLDKRHELESQRANQVAYGRV